MEEITTSTLNQKPNKENDIPKKEKVIDGDVKRTKSKKKFFSALFSIEDVTDIKDYLIYDCIVPAFKNTISDMIENSVSMILFGDTRGSRSSRRPSTLVSRTSYADYYNNGRRETSSRGPRRRDDDIDADEITFPTRAKAETVLDTILDDIDRYGHISIADYYDFCGLSTTTQDHRYGWTKDMIGSARVASVRGGYTIIFPRAIAL